MDPRYDILSRYFSAGLADRPSSELRIYIKAWYMHPPVVLLHRRTWNQSKTITKCLMRCSYRMASIIICLR
jgi:hypothetical protein